MIPKAIEAGLKRVGVVFDGNVFKKYYLNVILAATNKFGLPLKVFTDLETGFKNSVKINKAIQRKKNKPWPCLSRKRR